MDNRIRVYFAAFGDWATPEPVSNLLGREPTHFKPKGQRVGESTILRKRSIWEIRSDLPEDAEVETHLASLLDELEKYAAGIRSLAPADAGIQCAAYWYTSQPGFHLSSMLLSRVAALGLSLDFDMYCMGEADSDVITSSEIAK